MEQFDTSEERVKHANPAASVSIIMINRNGGDYLRRALRAIALPLQNVWRSNKEFEFIVVDNASTDRSVEIVDESLHGEPWEWRIVHESEPGVNSARLAGLRAAKGRYVIFTDNDLEFEGDWLLGYFDAFRAHPDCRVFAGRVLVGEVEGVVPEWLDLTGQYSRPSIVVRCDNGESEQVSSLSNSDIEGPVGPNMAFDRSVFDDYGPFDTNFGLRPGSLVAGAEAEFFNRLAKYGERFVYVPKACVYHPLKNSQISKAYFRRRLNGIGRVASRMQQKDGSHAKRLFGVKRYLVRQLAEKWCLYLATFFQPCPKKRFFRCCDISITWGQIQEDFVNRKARSNDTVRVHHLEPVK